MKKAIKDKLCDVRLICENQLSKEACYSIRENIVDHILTSYYSASKVFHNILHRGLK